MALPTTPSPLSRPAGDHSVSRERCDDHLPLKGLPVTTLRARGSSFLLLAARSALTVSGLTAIKWRVCASGTYAYRREACIGSSPSPSRLVCPASDSRYYTGNVIMDQVRAANEAFLAHVAAALILRHEPLLPGKGDAQIKQPPYCSSTMVCPCVQKLFLQQRAGSCDCFVTCRRHVYMH